MCASQFLHLSCLVCSLSVVRGEWICLFCSRRMCSLPEVSVASFLPPQFFVSGHLTGIFRLSHSLGDNSRDVEFWCTGSNLDQGTTYLTWILSFHSLFFVTVHWITFCGFFLPTSFAFTIEVHVESDRKIAAPTRASSLFNAKGTVVLNMVGWGEITWRRES